ncbi:MAG: insulinase family protein [Acidobacteria bacterium]|nr:insulinase family protein [Acidobacteriota bacterium]
MKYFISLILTLLIFTGFSSAQTTNSNSLKLPPYKKVILENGMTILLMEQHEVPFISFNMAIGAGSTSDPIGKEGLAAMTADLMRKGTKNRTAEQIAAQLEGAGIGLFFDAGQDLTSAQGELLKKDLDLMLEVFFDVLTNSNFPQTEVEKLQKLSISNIKEAKDSAQSAIRRYYNAYLFGNHPYARPVSGDEKSLASITRDDIVKFYDSYYGPSNIILSVVGDFSSLEMEKTLATRFGQWNKKVLAPTKLAEPIAFKGKKLLLVDKPDTTQTFFVIGNVGISKTNPDRVGIEIVNTLFGVRFTSLLNSELRIRTGLTYGARSSFAQNQVPGPFLISTFTQNATTEQAIDLALEILNRLHEKGITEEQLKSTKAYIKGQFAPDTIEVSSQLAAVLTDIESSGLDEKEINEFFAKIDAFTLADAQRIIKQYFPKENLVFVLIGKSQEISNLVKKYAPQVDTKQISQDGFK